jgi:subfamily B ATP-binding cassette protein HlyB/CyaB
MNAHDPNVRLMDPGLAALVMLLRFHGVGADPEQLRHRLGKDAVGVSDMIRCAKEIGLKVKNYRTRWDRLATTPLPGIAVLDDGQFLFIGKVGDDKAIVQAPLSLRPVVMTRPELEKIWGGQIVLMTRRAGLLDLSRRFDMISL